MWAIIGYPPKMLIIAYPIMVPTEQGLHTIQYVLIWCISKVRVIVADSTVHTSIPHYIVIIKGTVCGVGVEGT